MHLNLNRNCGEKSCAMQCTHRHSWVSGPVNSEKMVNFPVNRTLFRARHNIAEPSRQQDNLEILRTRNGLLKKHRCEVTKRNNELEDKTNKTTFFFKSCFWKNRVRGLSIFEMRNFAARPIYIQSSRFGGVSSVYQKVHNHPQALLCFLAASS